MHLSLPDEIKQAVVAAYYNIHRAGVLHGDVKLSHILVGKDGLAHVVDFRKGRVWDGYPATAGIPSCSQEEMKWELRKVKALVDWDESWNKELDFWLEKDKAIWIGNEILREDRANGATVPKLSDEVWDYELGAFRMADFRPGWFEEDENGEFPEREACGIVEYPPTNKDVAAQIAAFLPPPPAPSIETVPVSIKLSVSLQVSPLPQSPSSIPPPPPTTLHAPLQIVPTLGVSSAFEQSPTSVPSAPTARHAPLTIVSTPILGQSPYSAAPLAPTTLHARLAIIPTPVFGQSHLQTPNSAVPPPPPTTPHPPAAGIIPTPGASSPFSQSSSTLHSHAWSDKFEKLMKGFVPGATSPRQAEPVAVQIAVPIGSIPTEIVQVHPTQLSAGSSPTLTGTSPIPSSLADQITKFRTKYAAWSLRKQHILPLKRLFGSSNPSPPKSKSEKDRAETPAPPSSDQRTDAMSVEGLEEVEHPRQVEPTIGNDIVMEPEHLSSAIDQSTQARQRQRKPRRAYSKPKRATARIIVSPQPPPVQVPHRTGTPSHIGTSTHTDRVHKSRNPTAEYRKFAVQAANVAWGFQDHIQLPERGMPVKVGIQTGATRLLVVATVRQGVGFFPSVFRSAFSPSESVDEVSGGVGVGVESVEMRMKRGGEEGLEIGEDRKAKRARTEVTSAGRPAIKLRRGVAL
jgi:hypothetical protein